MKSRSFRSTSSGSTNPIFGICRNFPLTAPVTRLALFLACILAGVGALKGQTNAPIDQFPYQLDVLDSDTTWHLGDTINLRITIGTASEPIPRLKGYALELELADSSFYTHDVALDHSQAWWVTSPSPLTSSSWQNHTLLMDAELPKPQWAGWGELVRLKLKVKAPTIYAYQVIKQLSGIIIYDNVEARRAPLDSPPSPTLIAFPQPCDHEFRLNVSKAELNAASLFTSQGKFLKSLPFDQLLNGVPTHSLPAGIYLLRIRKTNGTLQVLKIQVQHP